MASQGTAPLSPQPSGGSYYWQATISANGGTGANWDVKTYGY
jgi:hypothetical protein